jgi:hypothetical protein
MIKIDFHGGTHGNFLEYVCNVYIMQVDPGDSKIFNHLGASHDFSDIYKNNLVIRCAHFKRPNPVGLFSAESKTISNDDKFIRIKMDPTNHDMNFVAFTNVIHRAANVGYNQQLSNIPDEIKNDSAKHRNLWYSRFNEPVFYHDLFPEFTPYPNQTVDFDFDSFYSWHQFCSNLQLVAKFCNKKFSPTIELYCLWQEFLSRNQGWNSYLRCKNILESIFSNQNVPIDCDIIEQGWINYNLTKMCQVYSGTIFDTVDYPQDTGTIYQLIQQTKI